MELIKELPEVFEEFAEQRQKSFMAMKGLKDQGVPVVGAYCTYFPAEIARAMGAVTVGLCSVSDETIPDAEKDLPKNLCPLIKSSYGFAKTDKCPFFYFSDVVVGETTCDGKKKMYELMGELKHCHIMQLPPGRYGKGALEFWKQEVISVKEDLEQFYGITITEQKIRDAIHLRNRERKAVLDFFEVARLKPSPITGYEIMTVISSNEFSPDFSVKFGGDRFFQLGVESLGNGSLLDASLGQKRGSFDFYGGIIRDKIGGGAAYRNGRWKFNTDLYDPNDLTIRLRGGYEFSPNISVVGQSILPHSREGGGEYIGLGYTY